MHRLPGCQVAVNAKNSVPHKVKLIQEKTCALEKCNYILGTNYCKLPVKNTINITLTWCGSETSVIPSPPSLSNQSPPQLSPHHSPTSSQSQLFISAPPPTPLPPLPTSTPLFTYLHLCPNTPAGVLSCLSSKLRAQQPVHDSCSFIHSERVTTTLITRKVAGVLHYWSFIIWFFGGLTILGIIQGHEWTCHPCREKGLKSIAILNVPLSSLWLWHTFASPTFYIRILFEWNVFFNFTACLCLSFGIQVCLYIESENKAATERGKSKTTVIAVATSHAAPPSLVVTSQIPRVILTHSHPPSFSIHISLDNLPCSFTHSGCSVPLPLCRCCLCTPVFLTQNLKPRVQSDVLCSFHLILWTRVCVLWLEKKCVDNIDAKGTTFLPWQWRVLAVPPPPFSSVNHTRAPFTCHISWWAVYLEMTGFPNTEIAAWRSREWAPTMY